MKYLWFIFLLLCITSCFKKQERQYFPSVKDIQQIIQKNKDIRIFKIDNGLVRQCMETNVDSGFIRRNLFWIDYDYWKFYSKFPIKYLDIHLIDTLLKINNNYFITFFESYSPPEIVFGDAGPYYAIKLMKLTDGNVISAHTLAEYHEVYMGEISSYSYLLPGNKIILNQENNLASDCLDENGKMTSLSIYITRYIWFDKIDQKFKIVMEKRKEREWH